MLGTINNEKVKVRVTCHRYGFAEPHFKGDVIEVTRQEVLRTREPVFNAAGHHEGEYRYPLMPLEMELAAQKEQIEPSGAQREAAVARLRSQAIAAEQAALVERQAVEGVNKKPEDAVRDAAQAVAVAVAAAVESKPKK